MAKLKLFADPRAYKFENSLLYSNTSLSEISYLIFLPQTTVVFDT